MKARARALPKGQMNKLERSYAGELEYMRQEGKVLAWQFEAIKLLLAERTSYTPDFLVVLPNGEIELIEVKGFWQEDARAKTKIAAARFPWFRFRGATWNKRVGWIHEDFPAAGDQAAQVAAMGGR